MIRVLHGTLHVNITTLKRAFPYLYVSTRTHLKNNITFTEPSNIQLIQGSISETVIVFRSQVLIDMN